MDETSRALRDRLSGERVQLRGLLSPVPPDARRRLARRHIGARMTVSGASVVSAGDVGSDVEAAAAAGAVGILVPTPVTRKSEVAAAPRCAATLGDAVDAVLAGDW